MGCAATTRECGDECEKVLRDWIRDNDPFSTEVHVSSEPPLVEPQHKPFEMVCPHGTLWYAVPTSEQIAAWAEAGIE